MQELDSYRRTSSWEADAEKRQVKLWQIKVGNFSDSEPLVKHRNYTDFQKRYCNLKCLSNDSYSAEL